MGKRKEKAQRNGDATWASHRSGMNGKLSNEKSTLNNALVAAQGAVISRAGELSEAQNSIRDLKLKLEDLKKMLSESRAREEILTRSLEEEKQLQADEAASH